MLSWQGPLVLSTSGEGYEKVLTTAGIKKIAGETGSGRGTQESCHRGLGCLLRLNAMANCTSLPRSPCLLGCLPDSSSVSSPPHYQGQAQACRDENEEELPRYLRGMEALGEQPPSILGLLQSREGRATGGGGQTQTPPSFPYPPKAAGDGTGWQPVPRAAGERTSGNCRSSRDSCGPWDGNWCRGQRGAGEEISD